MALEGGIVGRADDMVVVRGVNLYPSAVEDVVRSSGGVAEFRVETYTESCLYPSAVEDVVRSSGGVAEFRVETYTQRGPTEMSIQIAPTPEDPLRVGHR